MSRPRASRLRAVAWLGLFLASAAPAPAQVDTNATGSITLDGNERFRGGLTALDEGILHWAHPDARQPFRFPLKHVSEILFEGRSELALTPSRAAFRLAAPDGGADLLADLGLNGLNEQDATLESSMVSGAMVWPRALLKSVVFPHFSGTALLAGPASTNDWITPELRPGDLWLVQDGTWVSNGRCTLSRRLNLPDRIRIDFDLEMPRPINFKLGFFAQANTNDFRETTPGYYLECRAHGEVVLQRFDAINRPVTLRASARHLTRPGRTHYTLLADRNLRKFALLANGQPACQWQDDVVRPSEDRSLVLMSMGKPQAVVGLTVYAWHGNFDASSPIADVRPEDVLYLVDGTRVSGRITGLADGRLSLAGAAGARTYELKKIERIDFASRPLPAGAAPTWRLSFIDTSELAATPTRLEADGTLILTLPGGGTCRVRLTDIRRMFNPSPAPAPAPPAGR